jgi:hypothetical protein
MLTHDDRRSWYGWAELSPQDAIVAGSLGRWQIIYRAGRYGVAAGGSLKLLFRSASDWPALQGKDPYEESFLTVSTASGRRSLRTGESAPRAPGAQLAWRYEPRGYRHPWSKAVTVDVAQAGLAEGDTVLFYLGDPEGGSPGVRAQTFCERACELRVVVDAFGTGHYLAVPSPTVEIVGGPAARLALIVPSRVPPGEPFDLSVRVEDRWGNVARGYAGTIRLEGLPDLEAAELEAGDGGLKRVRSAGLSEPGIYRVRGREEGLGLEAESNPLQVTAPGDGAYMALWGDLHGQALDTGDAGALAAYFAYARDVAALDYCSHQGNDRETSHASWLDLQEAVHRHNEPGRFAAFLGYRWAGNTAGGGARNVLFPGDSAPLYRCVHFRGHTDPPTDGRVRAAQDEDDIQDAICYPVSALHDALRGREALLIAGPDGPPSSLEHHDPGLSHLLKVHTAWGQAPWLLAEALRRGLRVGIVANGANHQGRPGGGDPGAGDMVAHGGLTCAYATARTREAIWEALRSRRCYGTTGARILLDVQADGHPMGDAYRPLEPPRISVRVSGTAEIERVEIHRGSEVAYRYPEEDIPRPGWVRVVWGGALGRDWPQQAPWDGTLRLRGARAVAAHPYGFDSLARGIFLSNEHSVSWRSTTAGNENGLLLNLEAGPDAHIELYTPLAIVTVPLTGLPYRQDLGGEGLSLRIEPWPKGTGTKDLELTWAENALHSGTVPYYVIVLQVDGARAWSSPIYLLPPDDRHRQSPQTATPLYPAQPA